MTLTTCLECGEPSEGPRCPDHRRPDTKPSREARGYDWRWRKFSTAMRRRQPFCADCGSTEDLTVDHSAETWRDHERGRPYRVETVSVVCRSCNSKRGRARPRGDDPEEGGAHPLGKAKFG